jgi:methylenetetrahydrofolate--tRNA-(uracil-5-)-methyltransferase
VHRNTFVNAPRRLTPTLEVRNRPGLYIAGQMAGVEGYVESAALGWLAGVNAAFAERGQEAPAPPETTAHGALLHHLMNGDPSNFQPMNVTYGLFPPLDGLPRKTPKREKHRMLSERALADLAPFAAQTGAPEA